MLSKVFYAIAASVMMLTQLAHGAPLTSDAPIKGYSLFEVEWQLPIDPKNPDGKLVTVTGTIQEAVAKMDAAYPGWNATFVSTLTPVKPGSRLDAAYERDHYICNPNDGHDYASPSVIYEGIKYLRGLTSDAPQNAPNSCGRVSCSHNSGIWWCNTNNFEKQVTWKEIGDSAYFLAYECSVYNDMTWLTAGQEFFKDNWSVYVTSANC
ncbi:hypothetical protein QBC41DRAFT_387218 [Cercophora samala]|uniref:Uncharacterized protein n=1 Tax=Cercophora samala TaxID=330535 RepID=A0AA39ZHT6_9PEZI|nr:hypothetical protein QBC41DRAFT_387218 [Cercophora samala]